MSLHKLKLLPLKDLNNGPIQDGEISKVREAPMVLGDNGLYLLMSRLMDSLSRRSGPTYTMNYDYPIYFSPVRVAESSFHLCNYWWGVMQLKKCDGSSSMSYCGYIIVLQQLLPILTIDDIFIPLSCVVSQSVVWQGSGLPLLFHKTHQNDRRMLSGFQLLIAQLADTFFHRFMHIFLSQFLTYVVLNSFIT